MKVICKLQRKGGTQIEVNGKDFNFQPDAKGDHVCDIDDDEVAHRLTVQIPEAYQFHPEVTAEDRKRIATLRVSARKKAAQLEEEQKPKDVIITNGEDEYNLSDMDLAELAALARDVFEIKVHPKWTIDTIRAKIVEATRKED